MATVRLKNVNPLGQVDLPLLRRTLEPLEEFDCPTELAGRAPSVSEDGVPDLGAGLLAQVGNYEHADTDLASEAARRYVDVLVAHAFAAALAAGEITDTGTEA
jgi:hypothetical protein